MRVLVTGGSGFIGRVACAEATRRGHEVVVLDRRHGHDVTDWSTWPSLDGVNAVIHLAGMLGTGELFAQPHAAVLANIDGTLDVLLACEQKGLRYVGITMPDCWSNVYQATKLCAQRLAQAWHLHRGVPVAHVRAFNAYGPGQQHGPGHPQKIVPTFATRAWAGEPLPVWGDGTQEVDLVWVGDIARMLVDAAERDGAGEVYDAGTGAPMSVKEVARLVLDLTGSGSRVEFLPMRPGEHAVQGLFAQGDGWDRLDWKPRWELGRFAETVESYRRAAL